MKFLPLAVSLLIPAVRVSAQVPPPPTAPASGLAIASLLRSLRGLEPRAAEARVRSLAETGDAAARETLTALEHRETRPAFELRLAPFDEAGGLTASFRDLAAALEAAKRGDAAKAVLQDKRGPLTPPPGGEDKDGWEHGVEVFAGATGVPGRRLPAAGVTYEGEYNKGPWRLATGARGLFAPSGSLLPSDGTLEAEGSRKLGDSPYRLFAGAELHRDDLLGMARHFSAHTGVEADLLDSKRQTLSASFAAGGATEKHLDGETESHPLTLTALDYSLKLSARAAFRQQFELESNPRSPKDYEFLSITSVVYDLSKNLSIRAARLFTRRGEPIPGYADRRDETTVGLVLRN